MVDPISTGGSIVYRKNDVRLRVGSTTLPPQRRAYRASVVVEPDGADSVSLVLRASNDQSEHTEIRYDTAAHRLSVDRTRSGDVLFGPLFPSVSSATVPLQNGRLTLDVYVDSSSVEVFAQDGQYCVTNLVYPKPSSTGMTVVSRGGRAMLRELTVTAYPATR
ncbi:GH32 C-terminal domain-containing protein [Gordonia spumicola]|uniref:GH32 C-terminal domain-containing protein n=1 Tax=Gordonia spumicola TaxID=589161 RepID=UPI00137ABAE9|nr:GH32 C-terminal domain-containing protein [Gordonia spumicola]